MAQVYPTKIETFLAAEALRQEFGSKVTIMGAFAGGVILVAPGSTFPVVIPFAIYASFMEGEGKFRAHIKILDPQGNLASPDVDLGETEKKANLPMQFMINFNIFQFATAGTYRVQVILDDHIYENNISIGVSDKPLA